MKKKNPENNRELIPNFGANFSIPQLDHLTVTEYKSSLRQSYCEHSWRARKARMYVQGWLRRRTRDGPENHWLRRRTGRTRKTETYLSSRSWKKEKQ